MDASITYNEMLNNLEMKGECGGYLVIAPYPYHPNTKLLLEVVNGNDYSTILLNNTLAIGLRDCLDNWLTPTACNTKVDAVDNAQQYMQLLIDFARQKHVKRWNGRKTLNDFNLLDHAGRVANICRVLCKLVDNTYGAPELDAEFKLAVLEYALYHDYGETKTNDVASTVKNKYPELDVLIKSIEAEVLAPLELTVTPAIQVVVKLADIIDCLTEALLEKRLGAYDTEYDAVIEQALNKIEGVPAKYGISEAGSLVLVFQACATRCVQYLIEKLSVVR